MTRPHHLQTILREASPHTQLTPLNFSSSHQQQFVLSLHLYWSTFVTKNEPVLIFLLMVMQIIILQHKHISSKMNGNGDVIAFIKSLLPDTVSYWSNSNSNNNAVTSNDTLVIDQPLVVTISRINWLTPSGQRSYTLPTSKQDAKKCVMCANIMHTAGDNNNRKVWCLFICV